MDGQGIFRIGNENISGEFKDFHPVHPVYPCKNAWFYSCSIFGSKRHSHL